MKKPFKITLLIIAAVTIIAIITAIIMLRAVSGDNLFYMNSTLGSIYAISYRWVCLASGVLMLFWIILATKKRKEITQKLSKLKIKPKKTISKNPPDMQPADKVCTNCGKHLPGENKFCTLCGQAVYAKTKEENQ